MFGCCTSQKYTFASTLNQLDFLQFWYKIFNILPVKTLLKRPSERSTDVTVKRSKGWHLYQSNKCTCMRSRHAASNNSLLSGVEDCCCKHWIKSAGARSGIDNSSART